MAPDFLANDLICPHSRLSLRNQLGQSNGVKRMMMEIDNEVIRLPSIRMPFQVV